MGDFSVVQLFQEIHNQLNCNKTCLSHVSYSEMCQISSLLIWLLSVFGRPLQVTVRLCYGSVVLCVCLSVTLVYCGPTVGWIKMPLGAEIGLGPGKIVLDAYPAPHGRRYSSSPPLSAHVSCGQMVAHLSKCLLFNLPSFPEVRRT